MNRYVALILLVAGCETLEPPQKPLPKAAVLDVGPRVVSNQSDYPIRVYGRGFEPGATLLVNDQEVTTKFLADTELSAIVPAGIGKGSGKVETQAKLSVRLSGGETPTSSRFLSVVNDVDFPDPVALAVSKKRIVVANATQDTLWVYSRKTGERIEVPVGDRPVALAWAGPEDVRVLHEGGEIRAIDFKNKSTKGWSIPLTAQDLAATPDGVVFSTRALDQIHRHSPEKSPELVTGALGTNPGPITVDKSGTIWVSNRDSEDLTRVPANGKPSTTRHTPKTKIIGGHTEEFQEFVMGGKPCRDLVSYDKKGVLFCSSIGPNIGPNPKRMEVTMNGGISVVDLKDGRFVRHVSSLRGVPHGLALDSKRGVLYAADVATGRVLAFDANALTQSDKRARNALLAEIDMPLPEGVRTVRPEKDFSIKNRSSVAMHAGPIALALADNDRSLLVLNRFVGTVVQLNVRDKRKLKVTNVFKGPNMFAAQTPRRQGQVLYYTDLGNSRMTCDTCHPDGHNGGILFTKTEPMHIYRAPTIRATRESVPLFTPARLPSLKVMAHDVMTRNRFENPNPTPLEVSALDLFTRMLVTPPNPFVGADASMTRFKLPDGKAGDPKRGHDFFHKAACSNADCHPPPHFTADQSAQTRGKLHQNVSLSRGGSRTAISFRDKMQDLRPYGLPAPALVGIWDNYPLLHSGGGGFEVVDDQVIAADRYPALSVLSNGHGIVPLPENVQRDIWAYLLTL